MAHWSQQKERGGGVWQLKLMLALYRRLGARRVRAFLFPVVFFFFLFSPALRGVSRRFLCRVSALRGSPAPGARDVFRHVYSFSFSLVEKIAAWSTDIGLDRLRFNTKDALDLVELVQARSGAFIICSHLGNIEMLRALATAGVAQHLPKLGITSIVDFSGTSRFNALLEEVNPGSMMRLVTAKDMGADTVILLKERIAAGELVVIAGDRTPAGGAGAGSSVSPVRFLGEQAHFPQGAFILASLMDAPVYFMFGLREDDRDLDSPYGVYVYRAMTDVSGSRRERRVKIQALIQEFVGHLEELCVAHPYQWYNFYDFWSAPSGLPAASGSAAPGAASTKPALPTQSHIQ